MGSPDPLGEGQCGALNPLRGYPWGPPSLFGISMGLQHFQGGQSAVNRPLEGFSIGTPSPWRVLYEFSRSLEGSTWCP